MPKVKLGDQTAEKRYNFLAGMLSGGIRQKCLTTKEVSQKAGIPERTVNDRLLHPENMRVKDMYKLLDIAGIKVTFEFKEVPD